MEQITVKQAYFYTVSFILLMMMLYSLNGLVWQVIGIVAPPPLILGQWDYEDAKGQLLWEKYGVTENTTVSQILEILIKNKNIVVSKEQLLEKVWGFQTDIELNNIEVYLSYLRKNFQNWTAEL